MALSVSVEAMSLTLNRKVINKTGSNFVFFEPNSRNFLMGMVYGGCRLQCCSVWGVQLPRLGRGCGKSFSVPSLV